MQAGIQANQLASTIDHASNITNLPKITQAKVSFFLKIQEICSLIFVSVIKKVYQKNKTFVKPIHIMYVFIKGIIGKTNSYWHVHFFFDHIKLLSIKSKTILSMYLYPLLIKSYDKKTIYG